MPDVVPKLVMKALFQCEPGELIRLKWWNTDSLAFFGKMNTYNAIVCLRGGDIHRPKPCYAGVDDDKVVLSYGKDYRIDVDLESGDVFHAAAMNHPGVIIVTGEDMVLRATHEQSMPDRPYDLTTGAIGPTLPEANRCATFSRWKLTVGDVPVFQFDAAVTSRS